MNIWYSYSPRWAHFAFPKMYFIRSRPLTQINYNKKQQLVILSPFFFLRSNSHMGSLQQSYQCLLYLNHTYWDMHTKYSLMNYTIENVMDRRNTSTWDEVSWSWVGKGLIACCIWITLMQSISYPQINCIFLHPRGFEMINCNWLLSFSNNQFDLV